MADEQTASERIARYIEEHKGDLLVTMRDEFRREYPDSNSNSMSEDSLDAWSAEELAEICAVLRGREPRVRAHNTYEGDATLVIDETMLPIATFVEGRMFIARTLARVLWHHYDGASWQRSDAMAALDAAMLRIIRANLAYFAENELPDGTLMRTWDFSQGAATARNPRAAAAPRAASPQATAAECLTNREREIASLVAQGRTNGEIAAALGLSQSTVKNRLVRIFDKLGVNTRAELAARFIRNETQ
ncbi:helix-turn-helix transcriptional regulator [Slackia heliotrinireducens]|uniref:helix-turn-helix transcriptional regulator n=1 Tax=Slackia heliotrinireducens TaxID=84110 RepID=UPI003315157B